MGQLHSGSQLVNRDCVANWRDAHWQVSGNFSSDAGLRHGLVPRASGVNLEQKFACPCQYISRVVKRNSLYPGGYFHLENRLI